MKQIPERIDPREIIAAWLGDNGYDGLYDGDECGCGINDLAPCIQESVPACYPGYKHETQNCGCDACRNHSEGCDFLICLEPQPDKDAWRMLI